VGMDLGNMSKDLGGDMASMRTRSAAANTNGVGQPQSMGQAEMQQGANVANVTNAQQGTLRSATLQGSSSSRSLLGSSSNTVANVKGNRTTRLQSGSKTTNTNAVVSVGSNTIVQNNLAVHNIATENSNSTAFSILGRHPLYNQGGGSDTISTNVEDYQYEKLNEDYTEQGSDTAMLYERTSLEEYALAYEFGDTIYDLCFKTDPSYNTYEDLFTNILSCYNGGISSSDVTANSSYINYPIDKKGTLSQKFGWYSYLFAPVVPNDAKRYNKNVKLPAIAAFKYNTDKDHRTAAMAKHLFFMEQFALMKEYSNRYTNGPIRSIPHQHDNVGDDSFTMNGRWDDIDCDYGSEFFNGQHGGIIRDYTNPWKNLELRSSILTQWINNPNAEPFNNYVSHTNPEEFRAAFGYDNPNGYNYWCVPDIVEVTTDRPKLPVITLNSFMQSSSKWEDYNGSRTYNANVVIKDKATDAMYKDIEMFYKFFKKCTEIAAYPLSRGYSHKKNIIKKLNKEEYAPARLEFDNGFPYSINKSLPWTHYFNAWGYLYTNYKTFDPDASNPETMHVEQGKYQFYSWLWFHYKKAPDDWRGNKGMILSLDANNDRTLPYWYTNMNNMVKNDKPYVKVVYLSFKNNSYNSYNLINQIARQIKDNLSGSGSDILDNSFLFNSVVSGTWKLTNYQSFQTAKDEATKSLPFPDYDKVDAYIDD